MTLFSNINFKKYTSLITGVFVLLLFSQVLAVSVYADNTALGCRSISFDVAGGAHTPEPNSLNVYNLPVGRAEGIELTVVVQAFGNAGDLRLSTTDDPNPYVLAYIEEDGDWQRRNISMTSQGGGVYRSEVTFQGFNSANKRWWFKLEESNGGGSSPTRTMIDTNGDSRIDCYTYNSTGGQEHDATVLEFATVTPTDMSQDISGLTCPDYASRNGFNSSTIYSQAFTCTRGSNGSGMNTDTIINGVEGLDTCFRQNQEVNTQRCTTQLVNNPNVSTYCMVCADEGQQVDPGTERRRNLNYGDVCTEATDAGQICGGDQFTCRTSLVTANTLKCLNREGSINAGQAPDTNCTVNENECSVTPINGAIMQCVPIGSGGSGPNRCEVVSCTTEPGENVITRSTECDTALGKPSFCVGTNTAGSCISIEQFANISSGSSQNQYYSALVSKFGVQPVVNALNALPGISGSITGVSPNVLDWLTEEAGPLAQRLLSNVGEGVGGVGNGIGNGVSTVPDQFGARNCNEKAGDIDIRAFDAYEDARAAARADGKNPDETVFLQDYINCSSSANIGYCSCSKCIREGGVWTAIGCVVTTPAGIFTRLVQISLGLMGGVALARGIYFGIIYYYGDDKQVGEAREGMISTIGGIFVVILSVVILRIIGVNVLDIVPPGFFGS